MREKKDQISPELLRERAYVAYLAAPTIAQAAREVGVGPKTMIEWIELFGWRDERDKHYETIHERVRAKMQLLVEKRADLAITTANKLLNLLEKDLEEAEVTTKKEMWEAFSKGVEALQRVLGIEAAASNVNLNIKLSERGQEVYFDAVKMIDEYTDTELADDNSESSEE